ncbi:GNAT family N-acetyltransferase [Burkholderia pseudomallei]|uniref:GNAT family N-acetyltransferase n=1 Tax=Burkholderia pseudomallei TaxID=28450 RepID=UPI000530CC9A|nr:GNAT family protein [Burkholderia pseudomallei]KGS35610.1 acetyltransferase domain protein [Burkholderia pseudomallei MSHR5492]KGS72866.1 acetyltransferase domain protein [Burkholderia pseudomallei MSHR7334]MBD2958752.1 GNAT family N-acetyltransferase [Burkholderia pseudomallei]MBD2977477.1 GNAT family N-acetyltransferase [Burkholderia pseudomallei]OMR34082.1 acetyltransferase [Burkholderia pseudomallei]
MISIRLLEPADAAAFSALRLVAIDTSPSAIWPTRAEEAGRSMREVEARLRASGTQAVFGALTDDRGLIGIAGVRREALVQLAHKAVLWGVFVAPAHRGNGLARRLIDAALTHASRDWGVEQVNLCVNTENEPAKALYASLGFETFGVERRAMRVGDRFYDEQHMVRVRR